MRDKLRDRLYFEKLITTFYESIDRLTNWIQIGKTPIERVNYVKRSIVQSYISIFQCKYSAGFTNDSISIDLKKCILICNESWDGFWLIKTGNPTGSIVLNQYGLSGYDEMLWLLSLGYLLDIPNEDFKKLVEIIDRDGVKDILFEFIIKAKLQDRPSNTEESYQEYFHIPNCYKKLRQAIIETDKAKTTKLVNEFVSKDWYNNHKDAGWYNSHKSKHDTYFGYWSFETAAIVKIMGLDDSSFRDCQYYPKDLL